MRCLLFTLALLIPNVTYAQVAQFAFTSSSQSLAPNTVSETLTVQAQDPGGNSQTLPQTGCLRVETTSATGQFSTSATSWETVSVITMNSGTANKNFYYKDATSGTFTLTVKAGLRPAGESKTCTALSSAGEFPEIQWTASQTITITGSASTQTEDDTGTSDTSATTSTTQTASQTQTTPVSSYVPPPDPSIFVDAGDDRTVIVAADTQYIGRAYNKKRETVENVRFNWNFGDGTTSEGRAVIHHFEYPGKYIVVLTVAQNVESVSDRFVVTAEPAKIGFFLEADGSVRVENRSGSDLDLSSWIVRAFMRDFVIPDDTYVLAGASIRISPKTLGFFAGKEVELAYPNGVLALRADQASATASAVPAVPAPVPSQVATRPSKAIPIDRDIADAEELPDVGATALTATGSVASAAVAVPNHLSPWWLGALALATLACAALFAVRKMRKGEWDIVEDSG